MRGTRAVGHVALAAFAASASACSNFSGPPGMLTARGDSAPSFRMDSKSVRIKEFADLPQYEGYFPVALTVGSHGALWIADDIDQDLGESVIVRVTTSGKRASTLPYPNGASPAFEGIAQGSDGNLWATDWGDEEIVRMTPQGTFTTFPVPHGDLYDVVAGPDKALWFTEGDAVGRITTTGKITIYAVGGRNDLNVRGLGVQNITVGPDRALWFTDTSANAIGRITTRGAITLYTKGISASATLASIAPGPDGALWFTERKGRIGRITTGGAVTEYSSGIAPRERPFGIAAGPDNAMWFTESKPRGYYKYDDAMIGRISMNGKIAQYSTGLGSSSEPTAIVQAPDGSMWFVETATNRLGRVKL